MRFGSFLFSPYRKRNHLQAYHGALPWPDEQGTGTSAQKPPTELSQSSLSSHWAKINNDARSRGNAGVARAISICELRSPMGITERSLRLLVLTSI